VNIWPLVPVLAAATLLYPHSATLSRLPEAPCTFGRGNPIAATSGFADQFRCYQGSGRHVSLVGNGTFEEGVVSGGVCVVGVAPDRVQLAPCGSFSGDGALTLPYPAIAYLVDDPRGEAVNIYLAALFHR
jgi:hypothetical protein